MVSSFRCARLLLNGKLGSVDSIEGMLRANNSSPMRDKDGGKVFNEIFLLCYTSIDRVEIRGVKTQKQQRTFSF